MGRSTYIYIDHHALKHNLKKIKQWAPEQKVIAMVKANAYGCCLQEVVPVLKGEVYAWGVACLKEALVVRALDKSGHCILFQGIFSTDEFPVIIENDLQLVINHADQVNWLLQLESVKPIQIWLKIDTGMHRLGFQPEEINFIMDSLSCCPSVEILGLMTHMGCADEPKRPENVKQIVRFDQATAGIPLFKSMANSAAIMAFPETHYDAVRPGIMLYGVSPFSDKTGQELGLLPVMHLYSTLTSIYHYPAHTPIGYSGIYTTERESIIGIVAIGYGDGYPRTIKNARVWIKEQYAPIVGRVSMDMLAVDLTDCVGVSRGDKVELWGHHISVESVAKLIDTTAYELLCKVTERTHRDYLSPVYF